MQWWELPCGEYKSASLESIGSKSLLILCREMVSPRLLCYVGWINVPYVKECGVSLRSSSINPPY